MMYFSLVERDAQGDGWHLTPKPAVTSSTGGEVNEFTYGNEPFRDRDYKPSYPLP